MIRTEAEYQEAVKRLRAEKERMAQQRIKLKEKGLKPDKIETAMEPMESFHLQLVEEVDAYENLRRGDIGELQNLHGLGRMLIALRIARGLTQTELATRLGVDISQVSRDEKNEYHGVTVERANRILDTLNANLKSKPEVPILPEKGPGSNKKVA